MSAPRTSTELGTPSVVVDLDVVERNTNAQRHVAWCGVALCQSPAIGDRLAVIPSHCFVTTNLHDTVYGARDGVVEQAFTVAARGKVLWRPAGCQRARRGASYGERIRVFRARRRRHVERVTIGGYRIERLLGRGGQADVFLAYDDTLERPVALKLLSPLFGSSESRERLLHESRLAARLDHPNVVPIYEVGDAGGDLFVAMRYVEGTDLGRLVRGEHRLDPARALALLGSVASALDAAHARGIVHGDVKPSNILVSADPASGAEHVYLSDFGLSLPSSDAAVTGYAGSIHYSAPERVLGRPLTGRSDQYSLACVLVDCLTGRPPFEGSDLQVLWAHVETTPEAPSARVPELPRGLDAVAARALAKDPAERFGSCRELCRASAGALGLDQHRFSRRQLVVGGAAAAAVTAAAAVFPTVVFRGRPPKGVLPLAGDAAVRLDPQSALPTHAVPVTDGSGPIIAGDGSLWLGNAKDMQVIEIDPRTARIARTVDIAEVGSPNPLAVGKGALFLAGSSTSTVLEISGEWPIGRLSLADGTWTTIEAPVTVTTMLTIGDHLWTGCYEFLRFDIATGRLTVRIKPPGWNHADFSTVTPEAVWFAGLTAATGASPGMSEIARIDRASNRVTARHTLEATVLGVAAGAGGVWLLGLEDDLVRRADPKTGAIEDAFRVGRVPDAIGTSADAVWVTSARDGTVTRYDVRTADVRTAEIGGSAKYLALADGAVWTAVQVL